LGDTVLEANIFNQLVDSIMARLLGVLEDNRI
jgi:hypothetical protein